MKKITLIASAFALAAAAVSAPALAEPVTIQITAPNPNAFKKMGPPIAEAFMKKNPDVKVEIFSEIRSYEEQVQRTLRSAVVGKLEDVSFPASNQVRIFADRGLSVRLDDLIANDEEWESLGLSPAATALGKVGNETHALGFGFSIPVVFYNLDLVKRAGGDPDNLPASWDDIIDLASEIDKLGENIVGGFMEYEDIGNWHFQARVYAQGGEILSQDETKVAFNSPAGMRALEILSRFGSEAGQAEADMSKDQARQAFVAGQTGIHVGANSTYRRLKSQSKDRFELRMIPAPVIAGRQVTAIGGVMVLFAKEPKKQEAAWRFMKFAAGPEGQNIMARAVGWVPVNTKVLEEPRLLGGFYDDQPGMLLAFKESPRVRAMYAYPGENSLKIADTIKDHLQAVATLEMTPEEAVASMSVTVEKLLKK